MKSRTRANQYKSAFVARHKNADNFASIPKEGETSDVPRGPAPKKQYGQNFLTSIPAKLSIVEAGKLSLNDTVLEIGPGKGSLTDHLLATGARVVAIEKDPELVVYLNKKYEGVDNFELIEGDILMYEPTFTSYKLIANIPYYITGAIIEKFLTALNHPSLAVLLVQKEVAVRACARDKKESILSMSIKCYGEPRIVKHVSRGSFFPIPNVDSSVLAIENISHKHFVSPLHEKKFFEIMKAGFAHKRKFVISNLKDAGFHINFARAFEQIGLSNNTRAEDMTLTHWIELSNPSFLDAFRVGD